MGALLKALIVAVKNLKNLILAAFGSLNLAGWTVALLVPTAYILLWVGVLTLCFSTISNALAGVQIDIFGSTGIPDMAIWLANQVFPMQLAFTLTVSLLIFRLTAGAMMAVAIAAARKLK